MFAPSQSPNYRFVPPESPSPNLQTLLAYFAALNARDYDKVMAVFDEGLEHRILPKSLGRPVLNKKQYSDYFAGVMPLFKTFHLTLHEVIEAEDAITVHASSSGESASGTAYSNEHILIAHFVGPREGGDGLPKMAFVKEFVDSATSIKFYSEERAKAAKNGTARRKTGV